MLSIEDLPRAQEQLKERNLAKVSKAALAVEVAEECREIKEIASRDDLTCPNCLQQPTRMSLRACRLLPCKKCKDLRPALSKQGSSLGELRRFMRAQDDRCANCNAKFDNNGTGTTASLDKCTGDHDHVRGVLCNDCVEFLRLASANPNRLQNAPAYLRENKTERRWWASRHTQIWSGHNRLNNI
jgi:Recombination endonuclease VII